MCRPTTSPTRPSRLSPPMSTAWWCCRGRCRPRACIRRSIRSPRRRSCSIRWSSAKSMSRSRPRRAGRSSTIANCRTSLRSRHGGARRRGSQDRSSARRLQRFLTQPFAVTEASRHARPLGLGRRHRRRLQGDPRRRVRRRGAKSSLYMVGDARGGPRKGEGAGEGFRHRERLGQEALQASNKAKSEPAKPSGAAQ